MIKLKTLQGMAICILSVALAMMTAVGAFAATNGQGSYQGGGQQGTLIQALATASGQTAAQIQQAITNGQTLVQVAQQLAQQGTITQSSLTAAIQQAMEANDQQRASEMAQNLINGQSSGPNGVSQPPQGGHGGGQSNMFLQALATASGQTSAQIQQDITNGQTLAQIAQQLVQQGTITQSTLASAIQQAMTANDAQRASVMAASLISGQMPSRPTGNSGGAAGSTSGAGASGGIALTIGSPTMYVNGAAQAIDPGYQTAPVIVNNTTFIPIRAIVQQLGGTVTWDASSQQVTITLNNATILLNVGSKTATVNGTTTTLDESPFISSTGRTMLPLRFVAESLGHTVNWNAATKTITIQ